MCYNDNIYNDIIIKYYIAMNRSILKLYKSYYIKNLNWPDPKKINFVFGICEKN